MKIIRVFPRRTRYTPDDVDVRINTPPGLFDEADEIHISVAFTWDRERAEKLAYQWERIAPVKIGGPGVGTRGEEFVPGRYLKNGFTITSRGCPNRCWFCQVWKRDGIVRELEVKQGNYIADDNLLACSDAHIEKVFDMLASQRRIEFSGGLEARRLRSWHVERIAKLKPTQLFFSYDTEEDLDALIEAGRLLQSANISDHVLRCYVLCGYPKDTITKAEQRMFEVVEAGFMPTAMYYRSQFSPEQKPKDWVKFQREWSRPAIMRQKMKKGKP